MMPGNYQPQQEPPKSQVEVILENIIKSVVCIFIIVIAFFLVTLLVSMLNTQTAVQYCNYSDDFAISNPTLGTTIYTSNPLLSSITVHKYNSSNLTYGGVDSADWTYDADYTSIVVNAGSLEHFITGLRVNAQTEYSESPHLSVLTMWSISLIIMSIAGIFGLFAYNKYQKQQNQYPPYIR